MQILSLEVFDWCGLDHATLSTFSDRLTVVSGPNEAGKSRLVEALHFALFESHRGAASHKRELRSWGSSAAPRVVLRFAVDGQEFTVEKQFLDRPSCTLSTAGRTWTDRQALEELKRLVDARALNDRKSVAADLGLWPLVWVRQGRSRTNPSADLNADVQSTLESTLADQIGAVATGPVGLQVVDRVEKLASDFYTPTGRPTGTLLAATTARDEARERLHKATEAVSLVRTLADEVTRLQAKQESLVERERDARTRVAQARAADDDAASARVELEKQELIRQRAEDAVLAAERALEEQVALTERLEAIESRLSSLTTEASALDARAAGLEDDRIALDEERAAAKLLVQQARDLVADARALRQHTQAVALLEAREAQVTTAATLSERSTALRAAVDASPWDAERLQALDQAAQAATAAAAALAQAAVAVRFTAAEATTLSGETLSAGQERVFSTVRPLELVLPVGTVTVTPGAATPAEREAADQEARTALAAILGDCPSVAEARLRGEQRRDASIRLEECTQRLAALVPNGLAAAQASLEAQRDDLGATPTAALPLADAEQSLATANQSVDTLDARSTLLADALRDLRVERAACDTEAATLREEAAALRPRLDRLDDAETLTTLKGEAAQRLAAAVTLSSALRDAFAEAGGAETKATLRRRERALAALGSRLQQVRTTLATTVAQLEARVGEDLHGEVQAAEAEVTRTEAALCRIEARAESLRLLLHTLQGARDALQERLVGPVRQRIEPQIRRIFPNSRLAFDEAGRVIGLETGAVTEPFEKLSGGAQEQLGILVRMGLASIVAGDRRIPIVLDDALVNTDRRRLEAMLAAFDEAAESQLQVIVFTCHEADFDQLGADVHHALTGTRS